jgi:hypothetical protein
MGNWEHLLERNQYADQSVLVLRNFQNQLQELSIKIDKRNQKRQEEGKFPMTSFDPIHLESSVSV